MHTPTAIKSIILLRTTIIMLIILMLGLMLKLKVIKAIQITILIVEMI